MRSRASQRLEKALNAAGLEPLRDECQWPREPCAESPSRSPLSRKERTVASLEEVLLIGAAAVESPAPQSLVPVENLLSRHKALGERLEDMHMDNVRARGLLREVEAMLQGAIDDDINEGFVPPSARAPPTGSSAPGSARGGAALGGWLAPSRAAGGSFSARTAAAGRSTLTVAAWSDAGAGTGRGEPAAESGASDDHAEEVRARRLQKCELMHSQLAPMREVLGEHDASLHIAAAENARLAARAASALRFSAEELAAAMAEAEAATEVEDDAWAASMAADLANARTRVVDRKLVFGDGRTQPRSRTAHCGLWLAGGLHDVYVSDAIADQAPPSPPTAPAPFSAARFALDDLHAQLTRNQTIDGPRTPPRHLAARGRPAGGRGGRREAAHAAEAS